MIETASLLFTVHPCAVDTPEEDARGIVHVSVKDGLVLLTLMYGSRLVEPGTAAVCTWVLNRESAGLVVTALTEHLNDPQPDRTLLTEVAASLRDQEVSEVVAVQGRTALAVSAWDDAGVPGIALEGPMEHGVPSMFLAEDDAMCVASMLHLALQTVD